MHICYHKGSLNLCEQQKKYLSDTCKDLILNNVKNEGITVNSAFYCEMMSGWMKPEVLKKYVVKPLKSALLLP